MKEHTNKFTKDEIKKGRLLSLVSYLWIISLIVFLTTDNKYAKYHSKQSVRLSIIFTIPILVVYLINKIISPLWRITDLLLPILIIIYISYILMGMYDVIRGRAKELPLLNKIFKGVKSGK